MKEIQQKSIVVRVSARLELEKVRIIGRQLVYQSYKVPVFRCYLLALFFSLFLVILKVSLKKIRWQIIIRST